MPSLRKTPEPDFEEKMEAVLLDDDALDAFLSRLVVHGKSEASRLRAEERLRKVRRERSEATLADKAWPVPQTREQYKERLARILQACGKDLVTETLADPHLWDHDTGV